MEEIEWLTEFSLATINNSLGNNTSVDLYSTNTWTVSRINTDVFSWAIHYLETIAVLEAWLIVIVERHGVSGEV